jgi:hypothetical protein
MSRRYGIRYSVPGAGVVKLYLNGPWGEVGLFRDLEAAFARGAVLDDVALATQRSPEKPALPAHAVDWEERWLELAGALPAAGAAAEDGTQEPREPRSDAPAAGAAAEEGTQERREPRSDAPAAEEGTQEQQEPSSESRTTSATPALAEAKGQCWQLPAASGAAAAAGGKRSRTQTPGANSRRSRAKTPGAKRARC